MKPDCSIVLDLLPLYLEGMVREDTADYVRAHLQTCPQCRQACDELDHDPCTETFTPELPLEGLRHKLITKKIQTILLTVLCVLALVVSAYSVLDTPDYFAYTPELITISENNNGSVTLTFDEAVSDYACYPQKDAELPEHSTFNVEAWSSVWDRWFSRKGPQSVTLRPENGRPLCIYYVSNSDQDDVCIYGAASQDNCGRLTLPRLAAAYYLIAAGIIFAALLVARLFLRSGGCRIWIDRLMLLPVSYALSHLIVLGTSAVSYSLIRDLRLMAFLSVIFWIVLLLAQNLLLLHKQLHNAA